MRDTSSLQSEASTVTSNRGRLLVAPAEDRRSFRTERRDADLVIVGGGLAGTCAAITAARAGVRVILVHDRPVLGGNSSSEVRLWVLGATAHMSNNNRWAREGGVVDEILVENTYRNQDGNPLIFDTVLLEKATAEPNLTVLLNTALVDVEMADASGRRIERVAAFCSQNSTRYDIAGRLFLDSSGDGALAFLAGAAFRMGAEASSEFGEKFAPSDDYGHLLGHSIYFYSKDVGHPVRFTPPAFALSDLSSIPRARNFNTSEDGCRLWWIEWGGRLDTVHETETIKWRLWQVVYGVWSHLKNSGEFPEAENLTLEWVGTIPGKRESRRFEGLYMLRQDDVFGQTQHPDAVAYGGWSIDLHPADGVFSEKPGCNQLHSRGTYQIPYRSLVSRDVDNLFLAGRVMSASHVAFGSTRVMGTSAHCAQAVAVAAALCLRDGRRPADLVEPESMAELQRELLRLGQHIPQHALSDGDDLVRRGRVSATSALALGSLPANGSALPLAEDRGQLLPLPAGPVPQFGLRLDVSEPTTLRVELRQGRRPDDFTPDRVLSRRKVRLDKGDDQLIKVDFDAHQAEAGYVTLCLLANDQVRVRESDQLVTGLVPLRHRGDQAEDPGTGCPGFEFWAPVRRPKGRNLALTLDPPVLLGDPAAVSNGVDRPTSATNAWIAGFDDRRPSLVVRWDEPVDIGRIELAFDTDFDHAMESVLYGQPEDAMPHCVRDFRVRSGARVLAEVHDHHQSRWTLVLDEVVSTDELIVEVEAVNGAAPAAIFSVRCYSDPDARILRHHGGVRP
ncbi:FAD-dependent oxidoreductase [Kribbella amoyensis]|uniref:FAD-dependent oxidoreductase n=1 Tax=Kribbella amoyensis TaxID=996641 RepID=UPI00119E461B|nr:FAD-dependent oxidoreductase [Kribbella amoyensis]